MKELNIKKLEWFKEKREIEKNIMEKYLRKG